MTSPASLAEVRARAIALGREALLTVPIEEVAASVPDDEVGNILGYLAEHLGLATLGDVLESADATRVVSGALSPHNRSWFLESLGAFVAKESHARRRFTPREDPTDVEPPPPTAAATEKWAEQYGVSEWLDAPARHMVPFLPTPADWSLWRPDPTATIGDMLRRQRLPERVPPRGQVAGELSDAARAFLLYRARRRARESSRAELWSRRPAEPRLRVLSARLSDAYRAVLRNPASEAPVLQPVASVVLEDEPPRITTEVRAEVDRPWSRAVHVAIDLSGFETEPLALRCDCTREADGTRRTAAAACPHVRILLEWTRDAVHDPGHPLHDGLAELVAVPTWARFIEAVDREIGDDASLAAVPVRRLVFRIERGEGATSVEPAIQKRKKNGQWTSGSAIPLDKLLADEAELIADEDRAVLDALLADASGAGRADASPRVRREQALRALLGLVGHPRVVAADAPDRRIAVRRVPPTLALLPTEGGVRLALRVGRRSLELDALGERDDALLVVHDVERDECLLSELDGRTRAVLRSAARFPSVLPTESYDRLLSLLMRLEPKVELELPEELQGDDRPPDPILIARLSPSAEEGLRVQLATRPAPGGAVWPPGEGPKVAMGSVTGARIHAVRDAAAEIERAEKLRAALGLHESQAVGSFRYRVDGIENALDLLERLRSLGDAVVTEWPEDAAAMMLVGRARARDLRVSVRRAESWFGVDGAVEVGGMKVPLAALLEAARGGQRYVRVGPGRFAVLEDDLRKKLEGASDALFRSGSEVAVGAANVDAVEALVDDLDRIDGDASYRALRARMQEASALAPRLPEDLGTELRDYQRDGYEWLARLASWGAGACLADEMGLGKTVQALALMLARAELGPALVVAPTSVGPNWLDEAARFAPRLRARHYHGPRRAEQLEDLGPGVLLITSYDVLARDVELVESTRFATVVYDEAQALKNAATRRARAARGIRADFRLALTGTPLENHLGELWSLFHVVSPGLLGTWSHFRDRYALPIERSGSEERRQKLLARIRPFLLRRTKAQVAPELPPRTDVVMAVDLGPEEKRLYEAARREAVEALVGRAGENGAERFAVLAALTRLRRLACHPRLVDPRSTLRSAKLEAFLELVRDLEAGGHRALVFSQFTSHLALVREALDARGVERLYLDGATPAKQRAALVREWQAGTTPIFLISLKAGGTGLNLTAADYVVHLDPWWNPATEDQASDRAHRIGQTQPVTVVRLVAQNTIEEAVLRLHATKRELAEGLLAGADAVGRMGADELLRLVRDGAAEPDATDEGGEAEPSEPSREEA